MRRRLGEVGGNTLCAFYLLMCRYNKGPRRIFSAAYFLSLSLSLSLSLQSFKMELMIRSEPLRATISFFISLSLTPINFRLYLFPSLTMNLPRYVYLCLSHFSNTFICRSLPMSEECFQSHTLWAKKNSFHWGQKQHKFLLNPSSK